jgi:hypothetical protein
LPLAKVVGMGAALAAGGALFGLGAEAVERVIGGLGSIKRQVDRQAAYDNALAFTKKMADPRELHRMGLGPDPNRAGSVDPRKIEEEEAAAKAARKQYDQTFDTLYRYAPLVTSDPVVTAVLLRQYASSGQPLDPNQFRQLLDLEVQMHRVKTLAPYKLKFTDPKAATKFAEILPQAVGNWAE